MVPLETGHQNHSTYSLNKHGKIEKYLLDRLQSQFTLESKLSQLITLNLLVLISLRFSGNIAFRRSARQFYRLAFPHHRIFWNNLDTRTRQS